MEADTSKSIHKQKKNEAPLESKEKKFIKKLWASLNRDLGNSFLDADVIDLSRSIAKFLNQDIVGQKIILLDDGKLDESSSSLAIFLKRKRYLQKTEKPKKSS